MHPECYDMLDRKSESLAEKCPVCGKHDDNPRDID
eukprot:gene11494-19943_t